MQRLFQLIGIFKTLKVEIQKLSPIEMIDNVNDVIPCVCVVRISEFTSHASLIYLLLSVR